MKTATELLDVALKTERWIDSHRHETENGLIWGLSNEAPEMYLHMLYYGSAGIALFYLELWSATGEAQYLRIAEQAGMELVHKVSTIDSVPCAPMGGWGGYMFALHELASATGSQDMEKAAHYCAKKQREQAKPIGDGIGWIQEMPYGAKRGFAGEREIYDVAEGAAGAGLAWIYAHENGIHEDALAWSRATADRLLQVAEPADGGLRWQLMNDIPWPFDTPNFAHGAAGVAFFLARLYENTKEQKYLDAALAGAGHVMATADKIEGGGHLVAHILNEDLPKRFYLGWCHGPPGTARLYYLLGRITGNARWMKWGRGLDEGMVSMGAPEVRSEGFWNNIGQCCGDAGIGDHAVFMYRITGEKTYLELAQRTASELIRRSEGNEAHCCWPQAEQRTEPDAFQAQTGYMQGAAGVGSFFIHLATTLNGKPVKINFPESPYKRLER